MNGTLFIPVPARYTGKTKRNFHFEQSIHQYQKSGVYTGVKMGNYGIKVETLSKAASRKFMNS